MVQKYEKTFVFSQVETIFCQTGMNNQAQLLYNKEGSYIKMERNVNNKNNYFWKLMVNLRKFV